VVRADRHCAASNGRVARNTTRMLLRDTDAQLTLYLRCANRLKNPDPKRTTIIEGDVLDTPALRVAMKGHDVVYASLGIYGEVPGERYRSVIDPQGDSAAVIEASDLDYTILRPRWFSNDERVSYHLTKKGEPFKGHDVTLNSLSDLIVKLASTPGLHVRESIGVSSR
jgi:uncharacterized protein YbjT (DUF2867 family)